MTERTVPFKPNSQSPEDTGFISREAFEEYKKRAQEKKLQRYIEELSEEDLLEMRSTLEHQIETFAGLGKQRPDLNEELLVVRQAMGVKQEITREEEEAEASSREAADRLRRMLEIIERQSSGGLKNERTVRRTQSEQTHGTSEEPLLEVGPQIIVNGVLADVSHFTDEERRACVEDLRRKNNVVELDMPAVPITPPQPRKLGEDMYYTQADQQKLRAQEVSNQQIESQTIGVPLVVDGKESKAGKYQPADEATVAHEVVEDEVVNKPSEYKPEDFKAPKSGTGKLIEYVKDVRMSKRVAKIGVLGLAGAIALGGGTWAYGKIFNDSEYAVADKCFSDDSKAEPMFQADFGAEATVKWNVGEQEVPAAFKAKGGDGTPHHPLLEASVPIDVIACKAPGTEGSAIEVTRDSVIVHASDLQIEARRNEGSTPSGWNQYSPKVIAALTDQIGVEAGEKLARAGVSKSNERLATEAAVNQSLYLIKAGEGELPGKDASSADRALGEAVLGAISQQLEQEYADTNKKVTIEGEVAEIQVVGAPEKGLDGYSERLQLDEEGIYIQIGDVKVTGVQVAQTE